MRYYKQLDDGYITGIGTGLGGIEINETEYGGIMNAIQNAPDYPARLREDLTWEQYEPEEEEAIE